ncbi:MAG: sulfotransferase, partial [Colwelliaceae bacterium]|nr:sulfotransferase [Colwelliaceae bacterium]
MKNIDQRTTKSLIEQGWQALKNQQINDAIKLSQQLNQQSPNNSEAWYFTSQVAIAINNNNAAVQALNNACKLAPKNIGIKIILANFYLSINDFIQSNRHANYISALTLSANEHSQLGLLFFKLNHIEKATIHYRKAITSDDKNHQHYYNLATMQRFTGELGLAEENLSKAIKLNPLDVDAHALRVDLKKQTNETNSIESLTALLTKNLSAKDRVQVYFALAKSYEDLSEYGNSFSYLEKGNQLRRQHINYNIETDLKVLTNIQQTFDESWWKNKEKGNAIEQKKCSPFTPVFILGMPRTGSTLTDRILCANENVFSAGELSDFAQCLTSLVQQSEQGSGNSKSSFMAAASQVDFDQLGQDYLKAIEAKFSHIGIGDKINYIIDKLPFNYLYVGLIKKALPHAKI